MKHSHFQCEVLIFQVFQQYLFQQGQDFLIQFNTRTSRYIVGFVTVTNNPQISVSLTKKMFISYIFLMVHYRDFCSLQSFETKADRGFILTHASMIILLGGRTMAIMNWLIAPYISSQIFGLNKVVWPHQKFKGEVQVYHVSGRRRTGSVCERLPCAHILFASCALGRQPQIPIHQEH